MNKEREAVFASETILKNLTYSLYALVHEKL